MRLTELVPLTLIALASLPRPLHAEASAELLDLAARVHYGYYHGDARAIEAAQAALERFADSPEARYYRDFAALRRVQLGLNDRTAARRLSECAQREVDLELRGPVAADAAVLVAACAFVSGDDRRLAQALVLARAYDDDNPRIALVEAWVAQRNQGSDPERRAAAAAKLTAAVAAFEAWTPSIDDPDWGHAEALTALGASALERGEVRTARDLFERALLLAPDYRVAVELRTAVQARAAGNRAL
jgi:tetratricopeptide (TPR) repeat protein